jgi:hypothetical protein
LTDINRIHISLVYAVLNFAECRDGGTGNLR